nr:hypothetical protein Iba_chr14aCG3140 [Ipomoea batatas]GMD83236.1 hypothetical protein Iba_chr14aCG3150 [Ipomoea batatas]GMD91918.1 hypothetical protein Iba_chr14eCG4060 [Ipomoea batatas]GMD93115.1 hypothetical protein Iba_chr14fCG4300 [Ipomoea batatas]GME12014.1 hypothetical protein Iba_scaffold13134CG0240 [Ipomoea batatas]
MTTLYLVMEHGMPLTFDYGQRNQATNMTWKLLTLETISMQLLTDRKLRLLAMFCTLMTVLTRARNCV